MNRRTALLLYGILLAILSICLINCASCASRGGSGESMTLDSGVDKKSARGYEGAGTASNMMAPASPEMGYPAGEMAEESIQADAGYYLGADGDQAMPPTDASAPAPAEPAADDAVEPAQGVIDPAKLTEWMVPSAYAQDNMPDVRYLIRNGDCTMAVPSYSDAEKKLTSIALKYGGMVSDSNSQVYGDNNIQGWIKLRVQNEQFDKAWDEILAVGEVETKSISTQDVSAEYVASVSRLRNLLDEQATLKLMLDEALAVQRSRGLGEAYSILLDTQRRLSEVTSQIQATEDRIKALADQVTLSTITVNLREQPKPGAVVKDEEFNWGFGATLGNAFKDVKLAVRDFLNGLLYFIITCWTWLLPLVFFIWLGRKLYRRFIAPQLKKSEPAKPAAAPGGPAQ